MVISVEGAYDALKDALVQAEYSDNGCASVDPEVIEVVLDQLRAPKQHAFVLGILKQAHDNHPDEHGALVVDLLEGLRELGWTDESPAPLYPLPELLDRLRLLLQLPWSRDNTYEQGVQDALGSLVALYAGTSFIAVAEAADVLWPSHQQYLVTEASLKDAGYELIEPEKAP